MSACTFTTDTAGTVGGQRITWGEVNAQVRATQQPPADAADFLVILRLLDFEARAQGITVSESELDARIAADVNDAGQQSQAQQDQIPAGIAANAAQTIRPLINANGGAGLSQADLTAILTDEVAAMQREIGTGGTQLASRVTPELVQAHAISLRNALAARGVALNPSDLEALVSMMAQQLNTGAFTAADAFQQSFQQQGYPNMAVYRQYTRLQLLVEKMRPSWYKASVDAATTKVLVTDNQAKAAEAAQKGRAGTAFDELVKAYAPIPYQDPQAIDQLGSRPIDALPQQVRAALKSVQAGQFSDPIPLQASSGLYAVVYVVKVERRAPTPSEENSLVGAWVQGLRAKYPVTLDPALDTAPATTAP